MTTSLTIDRSSLSLSDLVIGTSPFGADMYLPEDGIERFDFDYRRSYAEGSTYAPRALLAAILEPTTLSVAVYCRGASSAALATIETTLTTAMSQWAYDLTLTIDGVSQTVTGEPTRPAFGQIDSGMVRAFVSRATLSIPINPQ
jgi:hypothetical protein